jgi:hypothetical protein
MLNWTRDKKGRMSAPSADNSFVWLIEQRGGLIDSLLPKNSLAAQRESPWVAGLYKPVGKQLQALMGAKTEKEAMAEAEGCEKNLGAIADHREFPRK